MAKVKVIFYGALAKISREKWVNIEASSIKELLNNLFEKYGEPFRDRILDEKGRLRRFIKIYVNGKDIRFLKDIETVLNERDEVLLIPAVGGG